MHVRVHVRICTYMHGCHSHVAGPPPLFIPYDGSSPHLRDESCCPFLTPLLAHEAAPPVVCLSGLTRLAQAVDTVLGCYRRTCQQHDLPHAAPSALFVVSCSLYMVQLQWREG